MRINHQQALTCTSTSFLCWVSIRSFLRPFVRPLLPSACNAGYYGREILNISRHGFLAGHIILNTIFQVRHKKISLSYPFLPNLARVFYIGGSGSRLLNRLLADPNLDLGLDRVGDQRRGIYYVVRRKEGRVSGETTGSPLWHGRWSFGPKQFRPRV